jgi:crossover junction endodeoxyribonuclease RuvC
MRALGLDPGIESFGWSVLEFGKDCNPVLMDCGVIKTPAGRQLGDRLAMIDRELEKIIAAHKPGFAAIEEIFFAKNAKTAIVVGHARGAGMVSCARAGLKIFEFTPLQVKQALTGYGRADKDQVGYMVRGILKLKELPKDDNTVDAIAVGICFVHSFKNL